LVKVSKACDAFSALPSSHHLYVEDANAALSKALAAGASKITDVADKPYQDRQVSVKDPCANTWWLSQRLVESPS
jgi:PhnB protein